MIQLKRKRNYNEKKNIEIWVARQNASAKTAINIQLHTLYIGFRLHFRFLFLFHSYHLIQNMFDIFCKYKNSCRPHFSIACVVDRHSPRFFFRIKKLAFHFDRTQYKISEIKHIKVNINRKKNRNSICLILPMSKKTISNDISMNNYTINWKVEKNSTHFFSPRHTHAFFCCVLQLKK